jgi:hypothetical protein
MESQEQKPVIKITVETAKDKEHLLLVFSQQTKFFWMKPIDAIKLADAVKEKAIEILRSPI